MSNELLGENLARALFKVGDDPHHPCNRIEFKSGNYLGKERAQGGFCESALAAWFATELTRLGVQQPESPK